MKAGLVSGWSKAWNRFWFRPVPTSTLGVLRIAFGLEVTAWAISIRKDLDDFFSGSDAIVGPINPDSSPLIIRIFEWGWGPLLVFEVLLLGAICLTVGYRSRLAAVLVFLALLAMQRRNPDAMNAGDKLLLLVAFYLMFAPLGASLSLDRWRRARKDFWEFSVEPLWALRLLQIQICAMYLFAVWEKVQGTVWNEGVAVAYVLGMGNMARFSPPEFLHHWVPLMNVLTWGTMAIELSIALLVWFPKLRPWVLGAGILLHVSIDLTLTIGFFSWTVFVAYLSFVPPETMTRRIAELRQKFGSRREVTAPV